MLNAMRAIALVLPLALVSLGSAQSVLLRVRPPVGKTSTYTMTTQMTQSVPGMPAPMGFSQSVPMTVRVLARKGNLTTMQTKMGQAKVTMPAGSPMAAGKAAMEKASSGIVSTTTVDELGKVRSATGKAGVQAMGMMQGSQGVSFPAKALKVGDTWTGVLDMSKTAAGGGKASGRIPIVYRLVSLSGNVATIGVTMKGTTTMNAGSTALKMLMNTTGTTRVDTATGLLKSMSMTMNNDISMGASGQTMRQRIVISMK